MKNLTIALLFVLSIFIQLQAQDIKSQIDAKKPLLFEKIYVHVDREFYAPGDKIWMKVYQVNGITHKLNSNFRNIFVQMVSEEGKVVKDMILFSINGQAQGDFKTESLPGGMYVIRAFTKYLENFGEEAYFHKKIWISKSMKSVDLTENEKTDYSKIDVAFLAEGGNLVLNAANTVVFKAIDTKGKGIYVSGKILNDVGDTITSFITSFQGMGKFIMMPEDGKTYFATIDQYPEMKVRLDQALPNGICLNFKDIGESLLFGMLANMKLDKHPIFYFVASHKGVVLFYKKIEMTDFSQALNLSKNLFPKGISKISLFDANLNPFAERLIFVDDGKVDLLNFTLNQKKFKPREEVKIDGEVLLAPGDSINSTMSVSVVNKNYFNLAGNSQNIKSYLLLDSDLKGAIETPASFFVDDELISSAEKLDLLMMVHGWNTYLWDDIEASKTPDLADWNDAGIAIGGYVKRLFREQPLFEAEVVLGPAGGNFLFEKTTTDIFGRFKFERMYLRDSTMVMINARTKNGSSSNEIRLDSIFKPDSIIPPVLLKTTSFDIDLHKKFYMDNYYRKLKGLGFNPEKGSILLSGIDVIEDRIPKGATQFKIYQNPDKSLKITQDDYQYNNILDYLEGKVAGLTITGDQISIRGGGMPLFLIDGIEISDFPPGSGNVIREIRSIRMNEIDKIEVLKSGGNTAIFGMKGSNGVIAIYRTTGDYTENRVRYIKGRISQQIKGYHWPRKFYSPKYTLENRNDPTPDYRPTLYWNPEVSFVNGKINLEFFTSDELAQYDIFIEGITKNGKICFGTTSFTVNKK